MTATTTAEAAGAVALLDRTADYVPSGTIALVPDLRPVPVKAPKPVQHCQAPRCGAIIGAHGLTPRARKGRRFCSEDCQRAGRRHERRTETADYAAMATRVIRKLGSRAAVEFDELAAVAEVARAADDALRTAVAGIRASRPDVSWAVIGDMLGISRQGAQQRFGK